MPFRRRFQPVPVSTPESLTLPAQAAEHERPKTQISNFNAQGASREQAEGEVVMRRRRRQRQSSHPDRAEGSAPPRRERRGTSQRGGGSRGALLGRSSTARLTGVVAVLAGSAFLSQPLQAFYRAVADECHRAAVAMGVVAASPASSAVGRTAPAASVATPASAPGAVPVHHPAFAPAGAFSLAEGYAPHYAAPAAATTRAGTNSGGGPLLAAFAGQPTSSHAAGSLAQPSHRAATGTHAAATAHPATATTAVVAIVANPDLTVDQANGNSPYAATTSASYGTITVGTSTPGGILNQSGGTLSASNQVVIASTASSNGVYNQTGGILNTPAVNGGSGSSSFYFNGGTLQASANSTAFMQGISKAQVFAGGATVNTQGFTVTVSQNLTSGTASGTADGGLTKTGTGTLIYSGVGSYTGPTTVNAGTLALNGGLLGGGGMITVGSGATLAGTAVNNFGGRADSSVTVQGGGTLSPGYAGAGRLTLNGTVTLAANSVAAFTLSAHPAAINGNVDGTLPNTQLVVGDTVLGNQLISLAKGGVTNDVANSPALALTLAAGFVPAVGDKFFLIDNEDPNGTVQGTFSNGDGTTFTLNGITYQINYTDYDPNAPFENAPGNDVSITVLAVPEPGVTVLLVLGGLGLGIWWMRRGVAASA